MRKTLITITLVLVNLLFNKHVPLQAQIKIYPECYGFGVLLKRINEKSIVCFNESKANDKIFPSVTYCLRKWTQENYIELTFVTIFKDDKNIKDDTKSVFILERNGGISFKLKGRHFDSWSGEPNTVILEKHRQDITQILNIIEKYPINSTIKDF